MLPRLAAFYEQNGDLALHTYRERQEVIEQYAEKYYPEELRKASEPRCFGKGADGTAYYFMPDGLSQDSLSDIGKLAEGYVIAAPKCTLPEARLEEYKIMFLKTGRDIPDKAVYGTAETAKREMRTEAEKVRRNADTLERVAKNARAALKELQADPNTDIVLCAVSPVTRAEKARHPGMKQIPIFNRRLKKLAKKMGLKYLDYTDFLKDSGGFLKAGYATGDGYHWKPPAYAKFGTVIGKYDKSLDQ